MAAHAAGKKATGVRFTIPSVEIIQEANKITADKSQPTLFKRQAAVDQTEPADQPTLSTTGSSASPSQVTGAPSTGVRARPSVSVDKTQYKALHEGPEDTRKQASDCSSKNLRSSGGDNEAKVATFTGENPTVTTTVAEPNGSESPLGTVPSYHPHAIITNIVQKNNPLMKHIRNVSWELGEIVPDFELGRTTCALFLSVKYHSLHPNYIHSRLKELGKQYVLRILLLLVDTTECQKVLHDLTKIAILADLTLILAWSNEEAARYLETYKAYENKPPDLLMERVESDFFSRATDSLTTVKKVNKTDVGTLLTTFKTMDKLITAPEQDLALCIDVGARKAKRLHDLFHESFTRQKKAKLEQ